MSTMRKNRTYIREAIRAHLELFGHITSEEAGRFALCEEPKDAWKTGGRALLSMARSGEIEVAGTRGYTKVYRLIGDTRDPELSDEFTLPFQSNKKLRLVEDMINAAPEGVLAKDVAAEIGMCRRAVIKHFGRLRKEGRIRYESRPEAKAWPIKT